MSPWNVLRNRIVIQHTTATTALRSYNNPCISVKPAKIKALFANYFDSASRLTKGFDLEM
jgi:hypothetical protein